eukprot:COSAG01_NODE_449_length_16915_cov_23.001903_13_plen_78_part_00
MLLDLSVSTGLLTMLVKTMSWNRVPNELPTRINPESCPGSVQHKGQGTRAAGMRVQTPECIEQTSHDHSSSIFSTTR